MSDPEIKFNAELKTFESCQRPWGNWSVLKYDPTGSSEYKVKELNIHPGQSLSMQKHLHRDEVWVLLEGEVALEITDLSEKNIKITMRYPGDSVHIEAGEWHRATCVSDNPGKIIEIQYGKMCVEKDIERKE